VIEASWSPLYDLYATSEDGKPSKSVSLHYRVNLQQRTGEDWKDAKLILSTSATDMLDAGIPTSDSLTIQPKEKAQPPPPPPPQPSTRTKQTALKSRSSGVDSRVLLPRLTGGGPPLPGTVTLLCALPPMVQTAAIVSKSPMAVSYTVEESTTIPSDHLSHKVLVAIIPFEAAISHITSPRKSPIAYLQVGTYISVQLGIKHTTYLPNSAPSRTRAIIICSPVP